MSACVIFALSSTVWPDSPLCCQFIPHADDQVVGVVTGRHVEGYQVDFGKRCNLHRICMITLQANVCCILYFLNSQEHLSLAHCPHYHLKVKHGNPLRYNLGVHSSSFHRTFTLVTILLP